MKNNQISLKITRLLPKKALDFLLYGIFILIGVKLVTLYFSVNPDDSNWNQFKEQHHCKLRTTEYGIQRSSWLCDDGNIYFRWRQQR